jgi:prefoldin beta subunit
MNPVKSVTKTTQSINMSTDESSHNPGTVLATAVDAEIATFRDMQEMMQQYQSNLQLVQSQRTENEMVLEEFQLLMDTKKGEGNKSVINVYKMIGPVLMPQNIADARETVDKRIQFITTEQKQIQNQIEQQEKLLKEQSTKVQKMQSMLQQSTVQAVQAIAQQHAK